jgi:hypothetical protein
MRRPLVGAAWLAWSVAWAWTVGCGGPPRSVGPSAASPAVAESRSPSSESEGPPAANDRRPLRQVSRGKLLEGALAVLDRLEEFDDERGRELIFDRMNQWARGGSIEAATGWRPDPLLQTLPTRLRATLAEGDLEADGFSAGDDVIYLRDQRWLADIARHARGDAVDDLQLADNLFRWTVRSLAPVVDPPMVPTTENPGSRWFLPGEIVLVGRASAPQRAWIFLQLLRHAGIDGAMLATGDVEAGTLRPWIPAALIDGEAYLYEPNYGMPIPGPGGVGVATVRQAAEDPSILAALSLPDRPYPVEARELSRLTVLVAADPWSLSQRMAALDPSLRAAREMRVAVDASRLGGVAGSAVFESEARQDAAEASPIRLWDFPWETLARRRGDPSTVTAALRPEVTPLEVPFVPASPDRRRRQTVARPLYAGRLREFRGEWDGPEGAKAAYLAARAGRAAVSEATAALPPEQAEAARAMFAAMKEDAAYWLGVLTLAEGEYDAAIDYLGRMILQAAPDSRWCDAARQNLARALIAAGRPAEAVAPLRADLSPQRFGSRWLADRLEQE